MKCSIVLAVLSLLLVTQNVLAEVMIIPNPAKVTETSASAVDFRQFTHIIASDDAVRKAEAVWWMDFSQKQLQQRIQIVEKPLAGELGIELRLDLADATLGDEGYHLTTTARGIVISAHSAAGIFYGLQSLRQLLPASIEGEKAPEKLPLPIVEITDQPRFRWRGVMLDESRHFFGVDVVKKLLDRMAMLKLNRFHWHLTDDEGWRIEIEKYPLLAKVGGQGDWSNPEGPAKFYTKKQVREIIAYAMQRHIEIIPEIDMPGHASAANRAYPEHDGGGLERLPHFTFNPGRDATYDYLTDICREVAELFPSPYLHMGGDEASFGWKGWPKLPEVKALMEREKLATLTDIDHSFKRRMAAAISNLGKTPAGWDECANAGIAPGKLLIFWWRHDHPEQLKKALDDGRDVVLCPRDPLYFDFAQDSRHKYIMTWVKSGNTLERIYPFPKLLDDMTPAQREHVLGLQCNLWTERVADESRMEYMLFPRVAAVAECGWTTDDRKDFADFMKRLPIMLERFKSMGIHFYDPFKPDSTPEPKGAEKVKAPK